MRRSVAVQRREDGNPLSYDSLALLVCARCRLQLTHHKRAAPESCEAILDVHIRIVPPLTLTGRACEDIKLLTDLVLKQYRSPRLLPGYTT